MREQLFDWIENQPSRSYAFVAWIMAFCGAFFAIAPSRESGFIGIGFQAGAVLSFIAYGASRLGRRRLALGLFLLGIVSIAGMFAASPSLHQRMTRLERSK